LKKPKLSENKKIVLVSLAAGVILTVIAVLASGFMIETTNTDTFCISCHAMTPFRDAWAQSVHGGKNPKGLEAQCVDCHLPHGNFVEYVTAKAITGTSDIIQNMIIDPYEFDWMGNAERRRLKFTYDSACLSCHHKLDAAPGMPRGGFRAHRAYLRGDTVKKCADCHPHVGHKNLADMVNRYFKKHNI